MLGFTLRSLSVSLHRVTAGLALMLTGACQRVHSHADPDLPDENRSPASSHLETASLETPARAALEETDLSDPSTRLADPAPGAGKTTSNEKIVVNKKESKGHLSLQSPNDHEVNSPLPPALSPEKKPQLPLRSTINMGISSSFIRVEGKSIDGSRGALLTRASTGIDAHWSQAVGNGFTLELGYGLQKISVNNSDDVMVDHREHTLTSIHFGSSHTFNSRLSVRVLASVNEQIFYRAPDENQIRVEKVPVTAVEGQIRYSILQHESVATGIDLRVRIHLPTHVHAYSLGTGHGGRGSIYFEQEASILTIVSEAYYSRDRFPAAGIAFVRSDLGIAIGARIPISFAAKDERRDR